MTSIQFRVVIDRQRPLDIGSWNWLLSINIGRWVFELAVGYSNLQHSIPTTNTQCTFYDLNIQGKIERLVFQIDLEYTMNNTNIQQSIPITSVQFRVVIDRQRPLDIGSWNLSLGINIGR